MLTYRANAWGHDWFSNTSELKGRKTLRNSNKRLLISEETFMQLFPTIVTKAYEQIPKINASVFVYKQILCNRSKNSRTEQSICSPIPKLGVSDMIWKWNLVIGSGMSYSTCGYHLTTPTNKTIPLHTLNIQNKEQLECAHTWYVDVS